MRGAGLAKVVLLLVAVAAAQEGPREFQVRPLAFSVAVPEGWTAEQGVTGLVARDAKQNGFVVTREPFLHDPETFATAWVGQLRGAKLDTKVEKAKACGRDAWHATWTAGDRRIDVWRVHVAESEMLYNFSFSGGPGFDLPSIVDPTLKSFKCAPPKAELKFQSASESVTTRISIRLPEGYEKEEERPGAQLGGGIRGGFVKALPGYDPPHIAGRIRFQGLDAGRTYQFPDGQAILGSDVEKILEWLWFDDQNEFVPSTRKPKVKDATFSGIKGAVLEAALAGKDGLPRRWMGFAGKHKQDVAVVLVLVDDREARLHKDFLKQVCSNLVVAK